MKELEALEESLAIFEESNQQLERENLQLTRNIKGVEDDLEYMRRAFAKSNKSLMKVTFYGVGVSILTFCLFCGWSKASRDLGALEQRVEQEKENDLMNRIEDLEFLVEIYQK